MIPSKFHLVLPKTESSACSARTSGLASLNSSSSKESNGLEESKKSELDIEEFLGEFSHN